MGRWIFARVVLSLLCVIQGLATLAIDLNHTHATNPAWPRHARFHLVWQDVSLALLAVLEVALIWTRGPYLQARFYLAAILACIPLLAFLAALASRKRYGGALFDPNGIPPARCRVLGRSFDLDLNVAAVITAVLVLAGIVSLVAW